MSALAHLARPLLVAVATDKYLTPTTPFPDPDYLVGIPDPMYGQDISFGVRRAAPKGHSVGTAPADLKPKMRKLLDIFASKDRSGMAKRLFDAFLTDSSRPPEYFDDRSLNAAATVHTNIDVFCSASLSAPNSHHKAATGRTRIHQALRAANWDINKVSIPTDLGVPAFNLGSKAFSTDDFANGLGLMINGVQHVYVLATHYSHDATSNRYSITLRFVLYDVFGLDDDDLREFGATSDSVFSSSAAIGITAWWQLQHQHGYAPLVTRVIVDRTYEAPAT
jgi:hypothetical protein